MCHHSILHVLTEIILTCCISRHVLKDEIRAIRPLQAIAKAQRGPGKGKWQAQSSRIRNQQWQW